MMRPIQGVLCLANSKFICISLLFLFVFLETPVISLTDDQVFSQHPYSRPPLRESSSNKVLTWGNDVTIVEGPVEGGISLASDTSGNLYAVRCSTHVSTTIFIYRSTDAGESWSYRTQTGAPSGSLLHPVLLTGSSGDKLYLFYLTSNLYGSIRLLRYKQDGTYEGNFGVKLDSDTITYFSACTDMGRGDYLMVAYQRERMGDNTPDLYTIVSTDQGETWENEVKITDDGSHPDIAYGNDGRVYLAYEKTGVGDKEIYFYRSNDYCAPGTWVYGQYITSDSYDGTYPKVAALHHAAPTDAYVWIAYNHEWGDGNIDLHYAYSTNGGVNWTTGFVLAASAEYDEMACDLWAKPEENYNFMRICYLKYGWASIPLHGLAEISQIHSAVVYKTSPAGWYAFERISDHSAAMSDDSREVCEGAYTRNQVCVLYAGKPSSGNFENLYFDNGGWTDVENEIEEEEAIPDFSLSANYPNPFNPTTRIQYTVDSRQAPVPTTLKIYNIRGQLVRTLVDEYQAVGERTVTWDGRDENGQELASGVYLYRLKAGDFSQTNKMVLIR
jgi:hypothetical protein